MKRLLVLLAILALCSLACAEPTADSLSVSSESGYSGATYVPVLVNITNVIEGPLQVIGFDVIYDHEVLELVIADVGSDLPKNVLGKDVWAVTLGTNKERIALTTNDQSYTLADGLTGNIAKLYFNAKATATPGVYPIELSNIDISNTGSIRGTIPAINGTFTITGVTLGDLNGDGTITSADAAIALQMAVRGDYDPLADLDNDYRVTSLDALMIIQQLAADPVISVSQQPIDAGLSDTFTAEVTVDPAGGEIYAAQYDLRFDPSILRAIGQMQGNFLSQGGVETHNVVNTINNTTGKIEYGETILGDPEIVGGATEPGVLASINFEVIGDGMSTLTLSEVLFDDLSEYEPTNND